MAKQTRLKQTTLLSRGLHWALAGVIGGCIAASALSAEIYKIVDEDGNVTYTDSPPEDANAEKLEVSEPNTIAPTVVTKRPPPEPEEDGIPDNYQLQISHPPDDFHVNPGMRNVNIQVDATPQVHPQHELQITDNGEIIEGTTMENIVVRGTHVIQAHVVDQQGRTISQSDPIQIHVHRPTVNN